MKFLKKFDYHEHKNSVLLLISMIILTFIIYYLIFIPFKIYLEKKESIDSFQVKSKKEERINQANIQRYNKLLEELEKQKQHYETLKEETKKKSFKNISSFESFISEKANSHFLTIETIGRIERIHETDKTYVPYIINGELPDIISFIKELENSENQITLTDSNTQLILSTQGKLITKISSSILKEKEEKLEKKDLIPLSQLKNIKIDRIKYLKFNSNNYIIINYKNGDRSIYLYGEEIEFNNSRYKIILENGSPFLQLIKN